MYVFKSNSATSADLQAGFKERKRFAPWGTVIPGSFTKYGKRKVNHGSGILAGMGASVVGMNAMLKNDSVSTVQISAYKTHSTDVKDDSNFGSVTGSFRHV